MVPVKGTSTLGASRLADITVHQAGMEPAIQVKAAIKELITKRKVWLETLTQ